MECENLIKFNCKFFYRYIGRNRIKVANAHPPRRPGERRPPRRYGGYGGFRGGGSRYGGGPRLFNAY